MATAMKDYNVNIYKHDQKELVSRSLGNAHKYFTRLHIEINELFSNGCKTPQEERRLAQLERLLSDSEKYECFFPVHKMPIYQDIISGDFIRMAEANELSTMEKQQFLNKEKPTMNQNDPSQTELKPTQNNYVGMGYTLAIIIIGGICFVGVLILLPAA